MPLDRRLRDGMQRLAQDLDPDVEGRLEATLRNAHRAGRRQQVRAALVFATVILAVVLIGPPMIDALRGVAGPGTSPSPTSFVTLRGTYMTTLNSTDAAVTSNRMAGDWTIQFGSGPIMTVTAPPDFTGTRSGYTFHVSGSQFRTDLFGEDVCSTLLPGTYQWSLIGGQLTFTLVDDSCPGRAALLTSATWNAATAK
jgi:ferric-dicitrate binding protein FerR (iron transport regulator)